MSLLYYDPVFQEHQTGNHPERPERLTQVVKHLQWLGMDACCKRVAWQPVSMERLARVHSREYAEHVKSFTEAGGGFIERDTVAGPRSYDVALKAAGAVCDAVERVASGADRNALCLVRPPGHHALPTGAMGFCLFNNVALGARVATEEFELDRVLIVDWDVHHGNGTQDAFWEDGRVGFLSIHRWPFYPGTGSSEETGSGKGLGMTVNLPIEFGVPRSDYLQTFKTEVENFADRIKPHLLIISAGFDSHYADPIGSLGLETGDFIALTRVLLDVASLHCQGRVVSVLEGGYNPAVLSDCVEVHLSELMAASNVD